MALTLKYTGPKPLCSCSGVSFDTSKQDKFIFISALAELIQALDHEYQGTTRYVVETGQKPLDENTIIELIRKHMPNFDEYIASWAAKTSHEIDDDIERAKNSPIMNEEERYALISNHQILRNYREQRSLNKSIYYAGIDVLANIIKKQHIQYIITPATGNFLHVLHSLQGGMRAMHPPIDSSIDLYQEQDKLMAELKIQGGR